MEYTKVDKKNLRFLFNSPRGHLYFRRIGKGSAYHQCDGWDYQELYVQLVSNKMELIWIEGSGRGLNVEVEDV